MTRKGVKLVIRVCRLFYDKTIIFNKNTRTLEVNTFCAHFRVPFSYFWGEVVKKEKSRWKKHLNPHRLTPCKLVFYRILVFVTKGVGTNDKSTTYGENKFTYSEITVLYRKTTIKLYGSCALNNYPFFTNVNNFNMEKNKTVSINIVFICSVDSLRIMMVLGCFESTN